MDLSASRLCTAFAADRRIASGGLRYVATEAKKCLDSGESDSVLIFDNASSELIEVDLRGSAEDVAARLPESPAPEEVPEPKPRGRGRPRLGVVSREVTLLPRHWDWLRKQPGGASVALRKLVEEARREYEADDRQREARESVHRFMTAMSAHLAGYEEALRALYAGDPEAFRGQITYWPEDLQAHVKKLALAAFPTAQPA